MKKDARASPNAVKPYLNTSGMYTCSTVNTVD